MKYWTVKEAYGKYIGTGITHEILGSDFSDDIDNPAVACGCTVSVIAGNNYVVSAVTPSEQSFVFVSPDELKEYVDKRNGKS